MNGVYLLILAAGAMVGLLIFINFATQRHNLNSIKDKTVGNGQHGTARWATGQEVKQPIFYIPTLSMPVPAE